MKKNILFIMIFMILITIVSAADINLKYPTTNINITNTETTTQTYATNRWWITNEYLDVFNEPLWNYANGSSSFTALSGQTITMNNFGLNDGEINGAWYLILDTDDSDTQWKHSDDGHYQAIYTTNLGFDNNYASQYTFHNGVNKANLTINYSIPYGTYESIWQTSWKVDAYSSSQQYTNITLNTECLNSTNLQLKISPSTQNNLMQFYCLTNTNNWDLQYSTPYAAVASFMRLYEESIYYSNASYTNESNLPTTGYFSQGASFDGTDDEILTNSNLALNKSTICMWTYTQNYTDETYNYLFRDVGGSTLFLYNTTGKDYYRYSASGLSDSTLHSLINITYNTWNYICGGYNGTHTFMLVNDEFISEPSTGTIVNSGTNEIAIGSDEYNNRYYYYGSIDEVRVWNRSLNQTEIIAEMNSPLPLVGEDLLLSYSFEDYNSTHVRDSHYLVGRTNSTGSLVSPAYNFDGTNNKLTTTPFLNNLSSDNTMCTWFKTNEGGKNQEIISSSGTATRYYGIIIQDTNKLSMHSRADGLSQDDLIRCDDYVLDTQNYHFACLTLNNEIASGYYDGTLCEKETWSTGNIYTHTNFSIGDLANYANFEFNGAISNVQIFNRSLSEEQIAILYQEQSQAWNGTSTLNYQEIDDKQHLKNIIFETDNFTWTNTKNSSEKFALPTTFTTTNTTWTFTDITDVSITTADGGDDWIQLNNDNISIIPNSTANISINTWTGEGINNNNFTLSTNTLSTIDFTIKADSTQAIWMDQYTPYAYTTDFTQTNILSQFYYSTSTAKINLTFDQHTGTDNTTGQIHTLTSGNPYNFNLTNLIYYLPALKEDRISIMFGDIVGDNYTQKYQFYNDLTTNYNDNIEILRQTDGYFIAKIFGDNGELIENAVIRIFAEDPTIETFGEEDFYLTGQYLTDRNGLTEQIYIDTRSNHKIVVTANGYTLYELTGQEGIEIDGNFVEIKLSQSTGVTLGRNKVFTPVTYTNITKPIYGVIYAPSSSEVKIQTNYRKNNVNPVAQNLYEVNPYDSNAFNNPESATFKNDIWTYKLESGTHFSGTSCEDINLTIIVDGINMPFILIECDTSNKVEIIPTNVFDSINKGILLIFILIATLMSGFIFKSTNAGQIGFVGATFIAALIQPVFYWLILIVILVYGVRIVNKLRRED